MTTDSVPDDEKARFWGEAVSRTLVPVEVVPLADRPFEGRLVSHRLGYLRVSTLEADAMRVTRTAALIARSPQAEAQVGVAVQVSGRAVLAQDGRRAQVPAGSLVLYDAARPYTLDYPEHFSTHLLQLPCRLLGAAEHDIRQVAGTTVTSAEAFGAVLLPFLDTLAACAHSCRASVGDRLAGSVTDLLSTLVAQLTGAAATDPHARDGHLVQRVREHIDHHLGDPELSPETITGAHHISVRYLHRLFEGEGVTVSRLIQQRRLEACARDLARHGRTSPTVSAVAQRWGFVNPAHFSRAFRAAYGVPPRTWRALRTTEAADGPLARSVPVDPRPRMVEQVAAFPRQHSQPIYQST
ncbi:helix-turn-helix domain-containing protein [Kitasatospora sp. NBC_01287]|uniref:AraC-like ligand-binding domain-containing protein n=1 Tax=Kitasatospora sp. NBC_01287 TaxID=2903573 RepID=UPI00225298C3|nr:helix-turn-helix domain-containing protein [Kitasatospora sp. NBC_01287]MCX4750098.1 helix-turn-helix domain-containing protein [Kitasatospora sp. NBC_01287]